MEDADGKLGAPPMVSSPATSGSQQKGAGLLGSRADREIADRIRSARPGLGEDERPSALTAVPSHSGCRTLTFVAARVVPTDCIASATPDPNSTVGRWGMTLLPNNSRSRLNCTCSCSARACRQCPAFSVRVRVLRCVRASTSVAAAGCLSRRWAAATGFAGGPDARPGDRGTGGEPADRSRAAVPRRGLGVLV